MTQPSLFDQPAHVMHRNSLRVHKQEKRALGGRSLDILTNIKEHGPGTDRAIAKRMGFAHRSMVQPRISDLIKAGHLYQKDDAPCDVTGKLVRVVAWKGMS